MTMPSTSIRQNVFYSVLDYVSQPAIMLIAAPLLLRTLGVQQYGTWMLVNSIAATASGLTPGSGGNGQRASDAGGRWSWPRDCGPRHERGLLLPGEGEGDDHAVPVV